MLLNCRGVCLIGIITLMTNLILLNLRWSRHTKVITSSSLLLHLYDIYDSYYIYAGDTARPPEIAYDLLRLYVNPFPFFEFLRSP